MASCGRLRSRWPARDGAPCRADADADGWTRTVCVAPATYAGGGLCPPVWTVGYRARTGRGLLADGARPRKPC